MNSQQLGKFFINEELVRKNPEIVAAAFKEMDLVVIRAEVLFHCHQIEYDGISSKFGEHRRGFRIPGYRVDIVVNEAEGENSEYSHVEVTKL